MNTLIIDEPIILGLTQVRMYAEQNPYDTDDVLDMYNKQKDYPRDNPNHCFLIPMDYAIIFSLNPTTDGRLTRYLEIAMKNAPKGNVAHPEAVRLIMPYLGFINVLEDCKVTMKEYADCTAVVISELI